MSSRDLRYVVLIASVVLCMACVPLENATVSHTRTIGARQDWEKCGSQAAADVLRSGSLQPARELFKVGRSACEPFESALHKAVWFEYYMLERENVMNSHVREFERVFVQRVISGRGRRASAKGGQETYGYRESESECARKSIVQLAHGNPQDSPDDLVAAALTDCFSTVYRAVDDTQAQTDPFWKTEPFKQMRVLDPELHVLVRKVREGPATNPEQNLNSERQRR